MTTGLVWAAGSRQMVEVRPIAPLSSFAEHVLTSAEGLELLRFSTGDRTDMEPPGVSTLDGLAIATDDQDHGSCGDRTVDIDVAVGLDADVAYVDVAFDSDSTRTELVLVPADLAELGSPSDSVCRIPVSVQKGATTCIAIIPRDIAGNAGPELSDCVEVPGGGCAVGDSHPAGTAVGILLIAAVGLARRKRTRGTGRCVRLVGMTCKSSRPGRRRSDAGQTRSPV